MKEVTEYFERMLWFVYRVLFTLLPSVFLLAIATIFINFSLPEKMISALGKTLSSFGFEKWIVMFAVVFCTNLILEALTNFFAYRVFNFKKISNDVYEKDIAITKLLQELNPKFLSYLKAENDKINISEGLFNFGLLAGQKSIWFNNYFWFLIAREFLFSNTALVFLLSTLIILPLGLYKYYEFSFLTYYILQLTELIFIGFVFVYSKILLNQQYGKLSRVEISNNKSNLLNKSTSFITFPLVIATLSVFFFQYDSTNFIGVFVIINSSLCFVCPILFLRALREYLHVEYLIMASFAKDNYDNQITDNKSGT